MVAFRIGTEKLKKWGIGVQAHGFLGANHEAANIGSAAGVTNALSDNEMEKKLEKDGFDSEASSTIQFQDSSESSPAAAQILGVAILECGVILHSLIIGASASQICRLGS